jgi:hypothetical protein
LVVVSTVIAAAVGGCRHDGGIDAGTFRIRADAVFCTDLVSARDTIISGVVDAEGRVSPEGVATFAAGYEPILRDHVAALQALARPDAEDDNIAAVADAATAVATRLLEAAATPATTASTPDDLRVLATSPALMGNLTAAGLRTC